MLTQLASAAALATAAIVPALVAAARAK